MFSTPEGPHLTPEQAGDLDSQFLSSRPLQYFRARIASLLVPGAPAPDLSTGVGAELMATLGADLTEDSSVDERDRELQVSVDAFSLRHHAAEVAVRLYDAIAVAEPDAGAPRCLWAAVVDGPRLTTELVTRARKHLRSQHGRDTFWTLVLPPEAAEVTGDEVEKLNTWTTVAGRWLLHAMELLTRDDLSVDAAHNKVKHGLAVRARDDELIVFAKQGPSAEGTLPVSAVTGGGRGAAHGHRVAVVPVSAHQARRARGGHREGAPGGPALRGMDDRRGVRRDVPPGRAPALRGS